MRSNGRAMIAAALLVAACGGEAVKAEDVAGRWQGRGRGAEFLADGRMRVERGAAVPIEARYEFPEPGRMRVAYDGPVGSVPPDDYAVSLRGDTLALCDPAAPEDCMYLTRAAAADPLVERSLEAGGVLKQAHVLQMTYRADHGRYAASFAELEQTGWMEPRELRYYGAPRIAGTSGEGFCIMMEPVAADLWPQHVDQTGEVKRGACP